MRYLFLTFIFVICTARPSVSETYEQLFAALNLEEIVSVIRQEGMEEAEATSEIYLKNIKQDNFRSSINELYSIELMQSKITAGLRAALSETDAQSALAFYQTPLGVLVSKLETTARLAISDDEVEEMAVSTAAKALQSGDSRAKVLQKAVTDMKLTEYNLSGAFSTRFAFLSGLAEAEELGITQDQIIALIAQDNDDLRDEIDKWVLGYVFMTYKPLSDEQLTRYLDFQMSAIGEELNRALFEVFNDLSVQNAGQLGKLLAFSIQARQL